MKKNIKIILLGVLIILIIVPLYVFFFRNQPNLISYSVGYDYGKEINTEMQLNKYTINQKDFAKGLSDAINHKKALYSKDKMLNAIQTYKEYQPGGEKYPPDGWMGSGA